MSLLRTGLILSLGIALMPSDPESQRRLYDRTAATIHWTATFCDRNGPTCENAASLWATFLTKAEFAGALVYDAVERYAKGHSAEPTLAPASTGDAPRIRRLDGTLSSRDLEPAWRGTPPGRQGI